MSSERPPARRRGQLFVISAPSGTGKTTVAERLVERVPQIVLSRSYTSREIRTGETDGVDYNFISRDAFEAMIARSAFLEWADVFGNLYGTGRCETDRLLEAGDDVVLVIDVQGARQVRRLGRALVSIFVLPPSFEVLEQRLRGRSKDADPVIRARLSVARQEASAYVEYDYVVVNDDLESCIDRVRSIINAERHRVAAMRPEAEGILRSFEGH